jgi:hypothetical protein
MTLELKGEVTSCDRSPQTRGSDTSYKPPGKARPRITVATANPSQMWAMCSIEADAVQ